MATVSLLTYVLVYFGIEEKRSEYLTPAVLILGIHLVVSIFMSLALIYIGSFLPNDIILISHEIAKLLNINSTVFKVQLFYRITAAIVFWLAVYTLFSFILVFKARTFLKDNSQTSHVNEGHRVYVAHGTSSDVLEYPLIHTFRNPVQNCDSNVCGPETGYVNTAF
uniref:Uncharacterized protein n=1 Tax=Panagrolaimus sp. PS1159 TaxID=55785 RepID=A0AC35GA93_9BILA